MVESQPGQLEPIHDVEVLVVDCRSPVGNPSIMGMPVLLIKYTFINSYIGKSQDMYLSKKIKLRNCIFFLKNVANSVISTTNFFMFIF